MELNNLYESEPKPLRKPWHTPVCAKKDWQTPRVTAIGFNDTRGGFGSGFETSAGTNPNPS
jgi:hypothetical protein